MMNLIATKVFLFFCENVLRFYYERKGERFFIVLEGKFYEYLRAFCLDN